MREIPCELSDKEVYSIRGTLFTLIETSTDQLIVNSATILCNYYGAVMDYRMWKKVENNGS